MNDDRKLLDTKQAADHLGIKERTLAAHWRSWGLTVYKIGRANRYRIADLERWLKDHSESGRAA